MPQKKNIRIKDIAEAAGVSVSTVSNVLSGKRQKNSESGKRVLEIAEEMGYVAKNTVDTNPAIRFVIYKKSGRVVMDTPFYSELFNGIEHACASRGYSLTFSFIDSANDPKYLERLTALFEDTQSPMLVLATEMDREDVLPFRSFKGPLVMLDSLFRTESFNTLSVDNYAAGWQGGEILLEHGHTRVGLITSTVECNNILDRNRGFRSLVKSRGLILRDEDIIAVEPSMDGSYRDMRDWLAHRSGPLPTGLFATNDIVAAGAMRAMAMQNIRIPDEVSIIGMDNMPFSRITYPTLSTLDVPKRQISELAVARLIQMIDHPDGLCLKTVVSATPILRDSMKSI